tara:strand:- start:732 stop:845 length:114 start_codon:yes stop_codon:yes gene_type:complete
MGHIETGLRENASPEIAQMPISGAERIARFDAGPDWP